ncbi:hypothetical protein VTK73DRAFT_369 [Phialemonium thermophilum]|uniref:Exonuclease domain-containing protein n=1 Tax=Phialemonium thermophilum TaxID=223376 RepID=A0ABR3XEQ1_9PEZI
MASHRDPLVWIDCEMTGLDPDEDDIIEIFCLITNGDLELADESGWGAVVHQPRERMERMNDWCKRVHGESGLTESVIQSRVVAKTAAEDLLAYIQQYVPKPRVAVLAGNSVHMDRAFLRREPYRKVIEHLHYRILDVSSLKEATRRWRPDVAERTPQKKGLHEAKQDILESIEEARFYKEAIFQAQSAKP